MTKSKTVKLKAFFKDQDNYHSINNSTYVDFEKKKKAVWLSFEFIYQLLCVFKYYMKKQLLKRGITSSNLCMNCLCRIGDCFQITFEKGYDKYMILNRFVVAYCMII